MTWKNPKDELPKTADDEIIIIVKTDDRINISNREPTLHKGFFRKKDNKFFSEHCNFRYDLNDVLCWDYMDALPEEIKK